MVPVDAEEGAAWGVRRIPLPSGVYVGSEVTLQFEIVTPLATGHYLALWAICPGGRDCDGAHCQAPDRPVFDAQPWWNTYLTYAHISGGWYDTDLGVRASTPVQLRHTSRLDRTGVYGWGYMPEFTDLATGYRFRLLHLRPQHPWATDVGRVYPAGYIVGLSGGDTHDADMLTYSTGQHLCIQTLRSYREAFPSGVDACR